MNLIVEKHLIKYCFKNIDSAEHVTENDPSTSHGIMSYPVYFVNFCTVSCI